jgi:hypothetical protein
MKMKSRYRLSVWLMIVSGAVRAKIISCSEKHHSILP